MLNDLLSPSPQDRDRDAAFLMAVMQQAVKPVIDRIEALEKRLDDKYYSKETIDRRFEPLERSVFNQSQRFWLWAGGIAGMAAALLTLIQHVKVQ